MSRPLTSSQYICGRARARVCVRMAHISRLSICQPAAHRFSMGIGRRGAGRERYVARLRQSRLIEFPWGNFVPFSTRRCIFPVPPSLRRSTIPLSLSLYIYMRFERGLLCARAALCFERERVPLCVCVSSGS